MADRASILSTAAAKTNFQTSESCAFGTIPGGDSHDGRADVQSWNFLLLSVPRLRDRLRQTSSRQTLGGRSGTRPWLLCEFDDPTLQALSAGQRILLRMGPIDERRVKVRLAELRRLLVADSAQPGR